ncbi:hypothetical protein HYV43_01590 [Candidatus Micrarchaeota archaeon]|nr:hypothetical protein [Candidatus Micrarchaeota archaeon]
MAHRLPKREKKAQGRQVRLKKPGKPKATKHARREKKETENAASPANATAPFFVSGLVDFCPFPPSPSKTCVRTAQKK